MCDHCDRREKAEARVKELEGLLKEAHIFVAWLVNRAVGVKGDVTSPVGSLDKPAPASCATCTGRNDCSWPDRAHGGPCSGYVQADMAPPPPKSGPRIWACLSRGRPFWAVERDCRVCGCGGTIRPGTFTPDEEAKK